MTLRIAMRVFFLLLHALAVRVFVWLTAALYYHLPRDLILSVSVDIRTGAA